MVVRLKSYDVKVVEMKKKESKEKTQQQQAQQEIEKEEKQDSVQSQDTKVKEEKVMLKEKLERPEVISAKVYKLKSKFVKHSIYITIGYINENGKNRPFEIFINSKDLTRAPEYAVLTRLISAIFRKTSNPTFILEELKSIHDPNGGYFKDGKYVHSLYAEIADVIEQFFIEIGLMKKETNKSLLDYSLPTSFSSLASSPPLVGEQGTHDTTPSTIHTEGGDIKLVSEPENAPPQIEEKEKPQEIIDAGAEFKICPECNMKTLKVEEGCFVCINPECGYSKCDN